VRVAVPLQGIADAVQQALRPALVALLQSTRGRVVAQPVAALAASGGGQLDSCFPHSSLPAPDPAEHQERCAALAFHRKGTVLLRAGGQEVYPTHALRDSGANVVLASAAFCARAGIQYAPTEPRPIGTAGGAPALLAGAIPHMVVVLAPGTNGEHAVEYTDVGVLECSGYDVLLGTPDCHLRAAVGLDFASGVYRYRPRWHLGMWGYFAVVPMDLYTAGSGMARAALARQQQWQAAARPPLLGGESGGGSSNTAAGVGEQPCAAGAAAAAASPAASEAGASPCGPGCPTGCQ